MPVFLLTVVGGYLLLSLYFTYAVHRIPRRPVEDPPDWGTVRDVRIPARDGGFLELWRVDPEGPCRGVVVLAHGWGRNRARMVARARIFGKLGFATVMHSARDHGGSSRLKLVNAFRFAEDVETVIDWVGEPVLLYGHSAGAAGAIIAASRHPEKIRLLFLEGCYARTKESLRRLYRNYNRLFGLIFGNTVVLMMDMLYGFRMDSINPIDLAPKIDCPVLVIHGEKDQNFPLQDARRLQGAFPAGNAELFVATGADHSSASLDSAFPDALAAFIDTHLNP
jgi:pimeloyl-ACP methyl ester carboxylesterase